MGIARAAASLAFEHLVALLAPPCCAACDAPVAVLATFCAACASTVERCERCERSPAAGGCGGGSPLAALVYDGAVARAIVRMKYGRRPDLARPLGDMLWRAIEPEAARFKESVVVPVPLHPARLAERGFNQSALVARGVARRLGAPFRPLALARVRDTRQQAVLEREERLTNVVGAFSVRRPAEVAGRSVLLVDDVCTTGATLGAAAQALRDAGAGGVLAVVVARTIREGRGGG